MAAAEAPARRLIAQNRKARHDYHIGERIEAGVVLVGTEVKSLRQGGAAIEEAYAAAKDGQLYLFNAYIAEYQGRHPFNHETRRPRLLLVHRRERDRLLGAVKRERATLVPLALYFNQRGFAKVEIGLATGKRKYDKRASDKARDWQRHKERLLRQSG